MVDLLTPNSAEEVLSLEGSSESDVRRLAAAHWGVPEDEVTLKIVEEEKSFFGLFGRKLRAEARPLHKAHIREFRSLLNRMIELMDLDIETTVLSEDRMNLSGYDSRKLLNNRAEGLKVMDYLANLMARNEGPRPRVRLDCDGYRRNREKDLECMALEAAKEAMKTKRTVYLESMSSWERRLVHLALRESVNVETHSVGVEPSRKVAVRLKGSSPRRNGSGRPPRRSDRSGQ